ncbi:MAG: 4,5-dihydroxyphthalate decarboxylase [Gammaproteobacteria bacterium]|nr:4,5-dihydroxyphthalate decarboxylase [Gammaproteobacteria bacterium]|tara:strand:+ start:896 stop:1837 length:942 start_codon:yes stop_codon:yes gene_type:complete
MGLKAVSRSQGANQDIKSGQIKPNGFELDFEEWPVLVKAFRAMVRKQAFDVCEMALTTYICARQHGVPLVGIPIFLVRGFHHDKISVAKNTDIRSVESLAGTKIGVNRGYTVTTGVWARTILDREGLDLNDVTWVRSSDEHVEAYSPPQNVEMTPKGKSLEEMLVSGELSAVAGIAPDEFSSSEVRTLISDPDQAALQALERSGFYPINHLIVMTESVVEAFPTLPEALFECFSEQKRQYLQSLAVQPITDDDEIDARNRRLHSLGYDPLPYGIEPNEQVLTELIDSGLRQKILSPTRGWGDYFCRSVLNLNG